MTMLLLDTNIISYIFKRDSRAIRYEPHLIGQELAINLMTIAELFQWSELRQWGEARKLALEQHLERYTLLPIDIETCRLWARVRANRVALGLPISPQDAWIAATALRYQISLVTHNAQDYEQIAGLRLISEPDK